VFLEFCVFDGRGGGGERHCVVGWDCIDMMNDKNTSTTPLPQQH